MPRSSTLPTDIDLTTARRAQIIRAAVTAIARDGADRAKLKDIADGAGVSLGMVQHYFRTRDELIAATFGTMMRISLSRWQRLEMVESEPLVRLYAGLLLHVHDADQFDERWGFWVEFWSIARRDPALARAASEIYALWTQPFTRAIDELGPQASTVGQSAADTAAALMALIDGLAVRVLVDPSTVARESMYRRLVAATTQLLGIDPALAPAAAARAEALAAEHLETRPLSPAYIAAVLDASSPAGDGASSQSPAARRQTA